MDAYQIKALVFISLCMGFCLYRVMFKPRDRKVSLVLLVFLNFLYIGVLFL